MSCFGEGFSIGDLKSIFESLDKDGDGTLDRNELQHAAKQLSFGKKVDLTKSVASAMLMSAAAKADEDEDGLLSWEEFLAFFQPTASIAKNGAPDGLWRTSDLR